MGKFLTEKETERLLSIETRQLPIPEPSKTSDGKIITVFKKRPISMRVCGWDIFDLLVQDRQHFYNLDDRLQIYTSNEILTHAAVTSFNSKTDIEICLYKEVWERFASYKEMNLPVLNEINSMLLELIPLYKENDSDHHEKFMYEDMQKKLSSWIYDLSSKQPLLVF